MPAEEMRELREFSTSLHVKQFADGVKRNAP
jgi:hypothetical protein